MYLMLIIPLIGLLFIPIVYSETTFFDNPEDSFIMFDGENMVVSSDQSTSGGGFPEDGNSIMSGNTTSMNNPTEKQSNINMIILLLVLIYIFRDKVKGVLGIK